MFARAYFAGVYFSAAYFPPKAPVSLVPSWRAVMARLDDIEALLRTLKRTPGDVSP
jgi:hypothetical protein